MHEDRKRRVIVDSIVKRKIPNSGGFFEIFDMYDDLEMRKVMRMDRG